MKTLKVEEVYRAGYETFTDVAQRLPIFIEQIYNTRRLHSDRVRDRNGDMGLAGPRAANQHDIALLAEDRAMDSATCSRNHGEARWPVHAPGCR